MSSKTKGARTKVKPEEYAESPPASADDESPKKDGKGGGGAHRTSKLGRKGDPRMHRAVAARLASPDMTLLQALRAGGFEFPDCDEKGGNLDGTICDADKVQLCQRKNQLSRRLRLARQAKSSTSDGAGASGKGENKSEKKNDSYEMDDDNELSQEAQDRLRLLIQQTQQRGKSKKRKDSTAGDGRSYKRMLSISAEDEVEVVEEDPYEEEIGADSTARRAKNHPLFQQRQPTIPAASSWGAAAQLGLAGMAANAAGAAATAQAAGQTTAAQQLQQAAAAYGAASSNTTAGAALAMAQARGGAVPAAAQHSFSFWPSLAAGGVAAAQRIIQQQQAQVQAQAQAQVQAQAQQLQQQQLQLQQQQNQQAQTANGGGSSVGAPGAKIASDGSAPSPSLGLTAASLGMSQDQLAAVLGGGGLAAGMQALQQQHQQQQQLAAGQQKQQLQKSSSSGVSAGASAMRTSIGNGPGGAGISDNLSACSSLSARDQVATALRQAANGAGTGNTTTKLDNSGKMSMALDMLRTESASLLKRCMLMAGFEPSETEECDLRYLEFAERAAEEEKQRISRIRARVGGGPKSSAGDSHGKNDISDAGDTKHHHGTNGCTHSHSDNADNNKCFDGRHVHRLEGKCGHQAVIHQPEDGQPHVDFVVDNKIECYGGMQGIRHETSSQALWPSKFSCDQLMCESRSDSDHGVTCGPVACNHECNEMTKKIEPKVLDLSDIDFDGKEWNMQESAGDETLIGLMSLGDGSK